MSEILSNKEITRVVRNMDCAEVRPFDIEFARAIERAVMQKLWEPVALPFAILDKELQDLHRFHECVSDGEGYDVPKERMKRLAEIGLVRRVTANIYEHTTFGLSVINGDFTHPAPIPEVVALKSEIESLRISYDAACVLVAQMHEAAIGRVAGPHHGVVEDIADLRADNQRLRDFCEFAWRDVPMNEYAFEMLEQSLANLKENHDT